MKRITNNQLELRVQYLNEITNSPAEYMSEVPALEYCESGDKKRVINIGHYHIDGAYGGVKLVRTCNTSGGIDEISRNGFGTKRELYNFLNAYISGIELGKE